MTLTVPFETYDTVKRAMRNGNLVKEVQTKLFIFLNGVHFQPSIGSEFHCFEDIIGKEFNTRIVDFEIIIHSA